MLGKHLLFATVVLSVLQLFFIVQKSTVVCDVTAPVDEAVRVAVMEERYTNWLRLNHTDLLFGIRKLCRPR